MSQPEIDLQPITTSIIECRDGDVLIVKLKRREPQETLDRIKTHIEELFAKFGKSLPVLVFNEDFDLSILRKGDKDAA